jgi:hypothetical protein
MTAIEFYAAPSLIVDHIQFMKASIETLELDENDVV